MTILKRLAAPRFWHIPRKKDPYVVAPLPGPHAKARCIPLVIMLRDMLKIAQTAAEAKRILTAGMVAVDGTVRRKGGFPVGLMDVVGIGEERYRVLPGKNGLYLHPISREEAAFKLCRIVDKTSAGAQTQLNLHDGRNMLLESDGYKTGDTIVYDLGKKSIKEVLTLRKGAVAVIARGKNAGKVGAVEGLIVTKSAQPNIVNIIIGGRKYSVPRNYVFVIGHDRPVIGLGE